MSMDKITSAGRRPFNLDFNPTASVHLPINRFSITLAGVR